MTKVLEKYFLDIVTGKKRGIIPYCLRGILWLLSFPFQIIITTRNWAFDHGWLRRYSPPIPVVISIGNIVVGGTGKTPVTLMIAQEFYTDFPIAILSRGYRSPAEKLSIPIMLSNGKGPMQSAAFCGDEPYLLAQNLPRAFVFVGKDRHKASDMAAKEGVQLILLDDGMQHRRLARDFEVVVIDMSDPFGQGYFLPRGLLREGISSLSRADLIILNHTNSNEEFEKMKHYLASHTAATIVGTKIEVVGIKTFAGDIIPSIQDKKVGIFCGIAHPEYFQKTVSQLDADIVSTEFTADHHGIVPSTLASFAAHCRTLGAEYILCTEKDKVKIPEMNNLALPLAWLQMRLQVIEGKREWDAFMENIRSLLKQR